MTAVVVLASLTVSVFGGWLITEIILKFARVNGGGEPPEPRPPILESKPAKPEVLRGGTWIGILERIAVTGAILAGQTALIAVVVAIKGLGRWADLQSNSGLTERFIIGTMASYLVAAACGVLGLWWLSVL